MRRVVIDGQAFRDLVAGKQVDFAFFDSRQEPVAMILSDIGFAVMRSAIDEAEEAQREHEKAEGPAPAEGRRNDVR